MPKYSDKHNSANPDPIDTHVGSRIRLRRTMMGLSQEKLADAVGITFQQVQKYENGSNRVGASRLYNISNVLDVPVDFFFEGYEENSGPSLMAAEESGGMDMKKIMESRETVELLRCYYTIKDEAVRKKVFEMIKSIANTEGAK